MEVVIILEDVISSKQDIIFYNESIESGQYPGVELLIEKLPSFNDFYSEYVIFGVEFDIDNIGVIINAENALYDILEIESTSFQENVSL